MSNKPSSTALGIPTQAEQLVPVLPQHRFDEAALIRYLNGRVPGFEHADAIQFRQFQGGQSNPTFHAQTPAGAYVIRKKPPGKLLPSAHAVDREFTVMHALAGSAVPVPKMYLLCTDESVIGTMFFVMQHVAGRALHDPLMPDVATAAERREMNLEVARTLARLHRVDYKAIGLESYGRPERYAERQVSRWSKQYLTARVEENQDMERLIGWLEKHVPERDEAAIAHGDFRCHNVIYHPTQPRIVAVIDWELSTIGHPLADLSYCVMPYHLAADDIRGFRGADIKSLGIPTEDEIKAEYCREAGRTDLPGWEFFVVFSLFRTAAIRAGIFARAKQGNAVNSEALEVGSRYRQAAARGWEMAQRT